MLEHPSHQCCVWDTYKFALYSKFREPKLYRHAAQGDWDLIPDRCKSHPKEARFVHKYAPMDTPLCRLLTTQGCVTCPIDVRKNIFQMKFAAVQALLEANVDAATARDTFQRTPLNWACMDVGNNQGDGEDESIIFMLLQKAPSASQLIDIERRTPLHYLVARNDEIPSRLVAKLVALYPEALTLKDDVGETPLDVIQSRKDEIKNANELIKSLRKLESMFAPSNVDRSGQNE